MSKEWIIQNTKLRKMSIRGKEGWWGLWGCAGVGGEESRVVGGLTEGAKQ